jgi:hypothetical protein
MSGLARRSSSAAAPSTTSTTPASSTPRRSRSSPPGFLAPTSSARSRPSSTPRPAVRPTSQRSARSCAGTGSPPHLDTRLAPRQDSSCPRPWRPASRASTTECSSAPKASLRPLPVAAPAIAQWILAVEFRSTDGRSWSAIGGGDTVASALDWARECCPDDTSWELRGWEDPYEIKSLRTRTEGPLRCEMGKAPSVIATSPRELFRRVAPAEVDTSGSVSRSVGRMAAYASQAQAPEAPPRRSPTS